MRLLLCYHLTHIGNGSDMPICSFMDLKSSFLVQGKFSPNNLFILISFTHKNLFAWSLAATHFRLTLQSLTSRDSLNPWHYTGILRIIRCGVYGIFCYSFMKRQVSHVFALPLRALICALAAWVFIIRYHSSSKD